MKCFILTLRDVVSFISCIKNNFNKKLSTISLRTKLVKLIKCTGLKKKKKKLFGEKWSHPCSLQ